MKGERKYAFSLRTTLVTRLGVEFFHEGDWVIWLWPWRRGKVKGRPFISTGFTGTGEYGDARYASLAAIDAAWVEYLARTTDKS